MAASLSEIQELADKILEGLGVRIRAGQMIVHLDDGRVQRVETRTIHKPRRALPDRNPQTSPTSNSEDVRR